ncbi:MAG: CPBP family intramembrane metalloprotease [Clostridia bacterium]|nr:CPBP family intramembrane metalloprotease [Clostridia bacterium]
MNKQSWPKTIIGIILGIAILVGAQLIALMAGEGLIKSGVPDIPSVIVSTILYPALAITGVWLVICKIMKVPLKVIRLNRFKPKFIWVVVAVVMPALAIGGYMFFKGDLVKSNLPTGELISYVIQSVLFFSIGAGIVEELVFRGVIMGLLENKTNFKIAMIIPSVLFGAAHMIGADLSFVSTIQLLIAGTLVGILFSLIAKYSDNIWEGAIVHSVWNASAAFVAIGTAVKNESVFTYVLRSRSFLITGGDFGMEASVISIAAYLVIIVFVLLLIKRGKSKIA